MDTSPNHPNPAPDPRLDRAARLIALCERRWNIPVLAELARRDGAKFATLVNAMGAPPASVRASLDALIAAGWVIPNPGYGHPLRPEYVLTPPGGTVADACLHLDGVLQSAAIGAVALRKWSIPVVDAVGRGADRFGRIVGALPGLTDRALSLSLRALETSALVRRSLVASRPPLPLYSVTPAGEVIVDALAGIHGERHSRVNVR